MVIFILYLFLAASLSLSRVKGATHMVGDEEGWTLFTGSSSWTQGKEFHVGDTLVFNYDPSSHNVVQVNSTAYEDCTKHPNMGTFSSGNDSIVLAEVGLAHFICGVDDHCKNGQKLGINIISRLGQLQY